MLGSACFQECSFKDSYLFLNTGNLMHRSFLIFTLISILPHTRDTFWREEPWHGRCRLWFTKGLWCWAFIKCCITLQAILIFHKDLVAFPKVAILVNLHHQDNLECVCHTYYSSIACQRETILLPWEVWILYAGCHSHVNMQFTRGCFHNSANQ